MEQDQIDALAREHTRAVTAIATNFEHISTHLIKERGTWAQATGPEVLEALLAIDVLEGETAQQVARAASFGRALPGIINHLTPTQKRLVSAVEGSVFRANADDAINNLDKLIGVARSGSDLELILRITKAIIADGADTLYDPKVFGRLTGFDRSDGNVAALSTSAGEVLADDAAGAVVGGIAGAVSTWWAGSGPGAAGGAIGGAIMFSGKALWDAGKKWWDGTYHGETDPVGPIGGGGLPDDIPVS